MEPMLTAREVASLKGCSFQYICKLAKLGKINAIETLNNRNRKTYLVPISELDPELQHKWYQMNQNYELTEMIPNKNTKAKPADHYSAEERKEIDFWKELIERWQSYRNKPGVTSKAAVDKDFETLCRLEYPDCNISIKTLYRKQRCMREGDIDGLLDKRGKWRKGQSGIDDTIWQAFLSYYLDQSQHPIQKCYEYTKLWAQEMRPELFTEIPSYSSFYRRVQNDITEGVRILGREGEKAFDDRCAPYIKRTYDNMRSNEWWIADTHTIDVIVIGKDGKQHRPYLSAFQDARSGIFTGIHISYSANSQSTLMALRKGILKYGIPDNIYVDNGREFLTFDIGGLGHRKKKPKDGVEKYEPPGVFKRLGINMTNALVRNAKAKIIERRFLDVKNTLSRAFESFTGGNVLEKPERLKKVLKEGNIYTEEEFTKLAETVIEYYLNQQTYNGAVTADKGKKKIDVFHEQLIRQRTATAEELSLMLMRSSRPQTVGRRGVHYKIPGGGQIDYWTTEFTNLMKGKKVYFRYDPDDLSEVRIYDLEDRYIMTVPADSEAVVEYGASQEAVKAAMKKTRELAKVTKQAMQNQILAEADQRTVIDLLLTEAERNRKNPTSHANPKILEVQRADEQPLYRKVSGGIDIDTMNRNAMKKQGGNVYE